MTETSKPEAQSSEPYDDWFDREAAKKINGVYANRIFVQPTTDGLLRLNFGEIYDDDPTYHTAIILSAANAESFARLIHGMAVTLLMPPVAPPETPEEQQAGAAANGA